MDFPSIIIPYIENSIKLYTDDNGVLKYSRSNKKVENSHIFNEIKLPSNVWGFFVSRDATIDTQTILKSKHYSFQNAYNWFIYLTVSENVFDAMWKTYQIALKLHDDRIKMIHWDIILNMDDFNVVKSR